MKRSSNVRGSRKFCQKGPNTDNVFLKEWREDPDATKSGPSSSIKWRLAGLPIMAERRMLAS